MKKWRKAVALTVTATMLLSTFALSGCKKKPQGEVVSEDTPWYTVEEIDLTGAMRERYDDIEYLYFEYLGSIDGNYILRADGSRKMPDDFDWENGDWSQFAIAEYIAYDSDGNEVKSIDANDLVHGDNEYIAGSKIEGNVIICDVVTYDQRTWDETHYSVTIDMNTGSIGDREEMTMANMESSDEESNEGTINVGDYSITKFWQYGGPNNTYRLAITDSEGNLTNIEMGNLFPNLTVYNIDGILDCGGNTALILASGDTSESLVFDLDLNTMNLTQLSESDTEWLKDIDTWGITSIDGKAYVANQNGLTFLDFDSKTAEEALSFSYCNINRYDANNLSLIDIQGDDYVFMFNDYQYFEYIDSYDTYKLVKLSRAESNPNVGKTIIDLCCLNGITQPVADAVCEYNETNESFFINYVTSYSDYDIDYDDDWTEDDFTNAWNNAEAEMSNQLAMDLMNGDGPDIIIGGFRYGQLNNENYLLDLSDYVNEYGTEGFFSNVFEGAKTGDSLYQLPLSFYISGILTDKQYVSNGQTGFTFDEYLDFVDEVCNGNDPITMGRNSYFTECLNAMNDLFIDGNSVDYGSDAFTELAQYCKDNVNETFEFDGAIDGGMYWEDSWEPDPAVYSSFSGFGSYLGAWNSNNGPLSQVILGLPSYDGRGPAISVDNSAAISAQAVDADACWDFIKVLLADDVQEFVAKTWSFPVNVEAFENVAHLQIDGYNAELEGNSNFSYSGRRVDGTRLDYSVIEDFEEECIATAHVMISDPSITVIITEEIPAYFSGQKNIDQVVDILENRVNTVLSERG